MGAAVETTEAGALVVLVGRVFCAPLEVAEVGGGVAPNTPELFSVGKPDANLEGSLISGMTRTGTKIVTEFRVGGESRQRFV